MFEKILVLQLGAILFLLSHEKHRPYYIQWGGRILAAATIFYVLPHLGGQMGSDLGESALGDFLFNR